MWRAANAITSCRTGRLGMHRIRCVEGHELSLGYNSCRHRFCNNCAALSREKWLSGWSQRLLDCPHHHVVFTVPQPLNRLWRYNRRRFSEALFAAASQSLLMLLEDPKYLGARPGLLAALHTWSQSLAIHVHLHVLVTAGGLDSNGRWRKCVKECLLPRKVLMMIYRGKLRAELLRALEQGELRLPPDVSASHCRGLLNRLGRQTLNVKLLERYKHGMGVARYLARYLKGGPLSNHRIMDVSNDEVRFRCRRSNGESCDGEVRLPTRTFLERILNHVVPRGMPTVRGYGLYAGCKREELNQARQQCGQSAIQAAELQPMRWQEFCERIGRKESTRCPVCGKELIHEVIEPTERGPPALMPKGN